MKIKTMLMLCYAMLLQDSPRGVNKVRLVASAQRRCVSVSVWCQQDQILVSSERGRLPSPLFFPFEVANPRFDGQRNLNDKKFFVFFFCLQQKIHLKKTSDAYLTRYRSKAAGLAPR